MATNNFKSPFKMSLPCKRKLAVAQTNHKPLQHCLHDAKAHSVAQRPHDVRLLHHCEIQLFPNLRWPSHEFPRFRQAQPSSRSLLAVAAPHKQLLLPCPCFGDARTKAWLTNRTPHMLWMHLHQQFWFPFVDESSWISDVFSLLFSNSGAPWRSWVGLLS